jgi:hypothetical protein
METVFKKYFLTFNSLKYKQQQCESSHKEQHCIKSPKPYTLARFEPTIFCSVGGDDDHDGNCHVDTKK